MNLKETQFGLIPVGYADITQVRTDLHRTTSEYK